MLPLKALTLLLIYLLSIPRAKCLCVQVLLRTIRKRKLTTAECASVLSQKKSAAHTEVGVLQTVLSLSGEYTQDLRFVHSTKKFQIIRERLLRLNHFESNFDFTFIRELLQPSRQGN